MINIQVTGPEGAGKGHLIALVTKLLRENGVEIKVQGEQSHLHDKFEMDTREHVDKLHGKEIRITELQTSK